MLQQLSVSITNQENHPFNERLKTPHPKQTKSSHQSPANQFPANQCPANQCHDNQFPDNNLTTHSQCDQFSFYDIDQVFYQLSPVFPGLTSLRRVRELVWLRGQWVNLHHTYLHAHLCQPGNKPPAQNWHWTHLRATMQY
jgi:hypothetical protein